MGYNVQTMNIRIKSTDYQITPEVQAYLDARLATLEKLIYENTSVAQCDVELGRDAGNQRHGEHMWFAEITVSVPGGAFARARNNAAGINAAIDDVKEEVERQLRKEKQAHMRFIRKSGAALKNLMKWGKTDQ
jgi:ribosomal subunit interface protein